MKAWAIGLFAVTTALYLAAAVLHILAGELLEPNTLLLPIVYAFSVVGVMIAVRRPGNRVAWICLAVGFAFGVDGTGWGIALYAFANPGTVSNPEVYAIVGDAMILPGIFVTATFLLLLFPNGRLPSRRWSWVAWLAGSWIVIAYLVSILGEGSTGWGRPEIENPLAISPGTAFGDLWHSDVLDVVFLPPLLISVAGSVSALVMRYRRSTGTERLQLKWFAFAGSSVILLFVVSIFLSDYFGDEFGLAVAGLFILIPVSIGIAVLRYRLYDIDRLISRTVTYALMAGTLAAVFASIAVGLPLLLNLPGDSPVLVAGATLTVAALFNPLRRRLQTWVDRRFNRARYDAQQEVEHFTEILREELRLDDLTAEVIDVVSDTMQPISVSMWVRGSEPTAR